VYCAGLKVDLIAKQYSPTCGSSFLGLILGGRLNRLLEAYDVDLVGPFLVVTIPLTLEALQLFVNLGLLGLGRVDLLREEVPKLALLPTLC
jgi:hypothetical protein